MTHHTEGERPLVLEPADAARVEAAPLARRPAGHRVRSARALRGPLGRRARPAPAQPAASPRSVHIVGALPLTAVGKVYKPALADDALLSVVRAEMRETKVRGSITLHRDDGRPHARIEVSGAGGPLAALLRRFSFAWSIAAADGTHRDTTDGPADAPGPPHIPREGERP
ncbi:hypothetical protein ACOB87_00190 [Streptomyces sp. YS-B37]|uniref:hypothetical protein n=1 Tax=Streptomyces sp. YS-B37 TaxID=3407669 RepID=UPI003B5032FB